MLSETSQVPKDKYHLFLETKTEVNMGAKEALLGLEKGLEGAENG